MNKMKKNDSEYGDLAVQWVMVVGCSTMYTLVDM